MAEDILSGKTEHADNSEREKREIATRKKQKADQLAFVKEAWGTMLATAEGRAVVWDIMAGRLGLFTLNYRQGMDETALIVSTGRREAAIELVHFLEAHYPRWYKRMLEENA